MPNFIPDWMKAIQIQPRHLFGILLSCAVFLIIPEWLMKEVSLNEIRTANKPWIALLALISSVFWLVQLIPELRNYLSSKKRQRDRIASLYSLSAEEWVVIAYCLEGRQQTIGRPVTDRVISGLVTRRLMYMGPVGAINAAPFTVHNDIWMHLTQNRSAFLESSPLKDDEIKREFGRLHREIRRWDD